MPEPKECSTQRKIITLNIYIKRHELNGPSIQLKLVKKKNKIKKSRRKKEKNKH